MSLIGTCYIVDATASIVQIRYELKNETANTLYVCHYHTALESPKGSHAFSVKDSKRGAMIYQGIKCKRLAPTANNFRKIDPNETITNIVELGDSYGFESGREYTVTATNELDVVDNLANVNDTIAIHCDSYPVTFTAV